MKQAIIILAHNDIELLTHLVNYFSHSCDVFIYIDKKNKLSAQETGQLQSIPQVVAIYQKIHSSLGWFQHSENTAVHAARGSSVE